MTARGLLVALVIGLLPGAAAAETPLAESLRLSTAQGQRYGIVEESQPVAVRVRTVFERIVRVAGRRPDLALDVHVLETPKVVLESLRGGSVLISRGAVDLAGADDAALAFLLAHEVAHHAHNHHSFLVSLGALGAGTTAERPSADVIQRAYQAIELDADRLGVLFAMLAGYRAAAAIPVLTALIDRSGTDDFHPQPRARSVAIRGQIEEVSAHAELFFAGLCLLNLGRPLEAARVLEHFASVFPAREVLSAIGVAYHREALRHAPPPVFRHVLVVDSVTRAATARGGVDPAYRALLERARSFYTTAVDVDPRYAPAQNNLASVYLDLGDRNLAMGHVTEALRLAPDLAAGYVTRGVMRALDRDWTRAEQDWSAALKLDPAQRAAILNLAAASDARGELDRGRQWRARLATAAPDSVEMVGSVSPGSPLSTVAPWLQEPNTRQFDAPLGGDRPGFRLFVLARRGIAVLARDGIIEAVGAIGGGTTSTAGGIRPGDPSSRVVAAYGNAPGGDTVQSLSLWTYASRGLVVILDNGRVQSAWTGRRGDQP